MVLSLFVNMVNFKEYYLISIVPNKITVENLKTGESRESDSNLVFSNDRLLIASATEPGATVKRLVDQLSTNYFFKPIRTVIVNSAHPNISKFSAIEKMILRDVGAQVGTRVYLSFDDTLTASNIDLNRLSFQFEV